METNRITQQDLNLPEYKGFMADIPVTKVDKEQDPENMSNT